MKTALTLKIRDLTKNILKYIKKTLNIEGKFTHAPSIKQCIERGA